MDQRSKGGAILAETTATATLDVSVRAPGNLLEALRPFAGRQPQRILHFTDSLEPSGVGEHIVLLGRELRALGHPQALVCPDTAAARPLLERCARLGIEVYPWRVRSGERSSDRARLSSLLRTGAYDLVHNHVGITWEGCEGTFVAAEAGVPVVCTEHLPYLIGTPLERARKLAASRLVAATIAVSHSVGRSLVDAGIAPAHRLHVVWNGIDLERFSARRCPEQRRALLGLDDETPLAVSIGRLTPQKDHATLLRAVALAGRRRPGLVVAVAGDGPLRAQLAALAAQLGIAHAVRFLGRFANIPALLACADALVQPSLFEGLPLAVLEGMAAALPVVVTDTPGNRETVVHGVSGLVVPPEDPRALAGALTLVLGDPALAARLGAQARGRVEQEFTAPVMARRTRAVYAASSGALRRAA